MRAYDFGLGHLARTTKQAFRREPWWAEFWSAVTAIGWAVVSWTSPDALGAWPSMQVLLRVGGEQFWQLAGFGLGVGQLWFLVADRRWLRWGVAVMMCWFWAVLTLGVWTALPGAPGAPGAAVYAGWCGINVFSILRLLRQYG